MKKLLVKLLTAALAIALTLSAGITALAYNDRKPTKITAVSKISKSVKKGSVFSLKVRANGEDDYLYWTITSGKDIVRFNDKDRSDDDIELKAKKEGTAKVVCKIKGTKKKITFTVKVKKAAKTSYIGSQKAKSIALKNAKLTASKVYGLRVKREKDDGRIVYDVNFCKGKYEYDYEIDAKTGRIIDKDKDYID